MWVNVALKETERTLQKESEDAEEQMRLRREALEFEKSKLEDIDAKLENRENIIADANDKLLESSIHDVDDFWNFVEESLSTEKKWEDS